MTLEDIAKLPFPVRYIRSTDNDPNGYAICINGTEIVDLRLDNHIQHDIDLDTGAFADYYYSQHSEASWEPCSKYGHPVN